MLRNKFAHLVLLLFVVVGMLPLGVAHKEKNHNTPLFYFN